MILPRNLLFSKRYFWFSDDALEAKHLTAYHKTDKSDTHGNTAWATETGKGLLFFAKRSEDKAHPTGIINLVCTFVVICIRRHVDLLL